MPPRMFSVEGSMGLRSWRYADGTANLRAVVAASSSIADGCRKCAEASAHENQPVSRDCNRQSKEKQRNCFPGFHVYLSCPAASPSARPNEGRYLPKFNSKSLRTP
jgi:hypothetical protein